MPTDPLVSVIVPSYNHEKYIGQCISSILDQTYKNIQLIVIDDGSTDSSPLILKELSGRYNFVYEARANHGLTKTLNYAIKKYATGEYIAAVGSDDYWHPKKIASQVSFMQQHPTCGMCCSMAYVVDDNNNPERLLGDGIKDSDVELSSLLLINKIPAVTALYIKIIFDTAGGYDESLYFEDWDLWLTIASQSKIGIIREPLAFYRKHSANMSAKSLLMVNDQIKIIQKWSHHPSYPKAMAYQQFIHLKIVLLQTKNTKDALLLWAKNFKKYYFNYHYYFILYKIFIYGNAKK